MEPAVVTELSGESLPFMKVPPPGTRSQELAENLKQFESPGVSSIGLGKIPIFWEAAKGANVVDVDGNIYIDTAAAFAVVSLGHGNERVVEAIRWQAGKLLHGQGAVHPCAVRADLVKLLAEVTPGDLQKAILPNTGAEAVEVAVKTARMFTKRPYVLSFQGGFHGKLLGAVSFTSRNSYREPFLPLLPGVVHAPYAYCYRCSFKLAYGKCNMCCLSYLEHLLDNPSTGIGEVAAMVMEPVQGHEGGIAPPDEFVAGVRRLTQSRGILLIADEIITGFGRTGKMFGVDHAGIVPDIMCFGKSMAGGFPISAAIAKPHIMDAWQSRTGEATHSSTFMGHPLGCAAAIAGINEVISRDLPARAERLGGYVRDQVKKLQQKHEVIGDVRGRGMIVGIELVEDPESKKPAPEMADRLVRGFLEKGVIVNKGGMYENVLKITPPIVITKEQLDFFLGVFEELLHGSNKNS